MSAVCLTQGASESRFYPVRPLCRGQNAGDADSERKTRCRPQPSEPAARPAPARSSRNKRPAPRWHCGCCASLLNPVQSSCFRARPRCDTGGTGRPVPRPAHPDRRCFAGRQARRPAVIIFRDADSLRHISKFAVAVVQPDPLLFISRQTAALHRRPIFASPIMVLLPMAILPKSYQ